MKPEPFDGSSYWEEYCFHLINCSELGRWANHDNILGLSANLRGPVPIFYMSLLQDVRAEYYRLVGSVRQQISGSVKEWV